MATSQVPPKTSNDETFLPDRLKYQNCLGSGKFGVVLKTVAESKQSAIAVKFLFPTEKECQEILMESSAMGSQLINHENIVHVNSVARKELNARELGTIFTDVILLPDAAQGLLDDVYRRLYVAPIRRSRVIASVCIQMELCGENLRRWLGENKKRDCDNICLQLQQMTITKDLITGLKHLHDNKIIHRNLKPENVMFSSANYRFPVKIGNFGVSKKLPLDCTETESFVNYIAPEVLDGSKDYSYQSDLYSLGLIIWEVVQPVKALLSQKLAYDKQEILLKIHPLMGAVNKVIIQLTKRNTIDRVNSIHDVAEFSAGLGLKGWEKFLIANKQEIYVWNSSGQICEIAFCPINPQEMHVKNSGELELCMKYVKCGWVIVLTGKVFIGPFTLNADNVCIRGRRVRESRVRVIVCNSINSAGLQVLGNDCNISDVKIEAKGCLGIQLTGSRNVIRNVESRGCILVDGDENRLEDLNILHSTNGIIVQSCKNVIDNVSLETIKECGIIIASNSNGNTISNISGSKMTSGIQVFGSDNHLSNITFERRKLKEKDKGINFRGMELFSSGSYNTIQNFIFHSVKNDWGLYISGNNSIVTDSKCGPRLYLGGSNNTLINVDCGKFASVPIDVADLNLIRCIGNKISLNTLPENVRPIECDYKRVLNKDEVKRDIESFVPTVVHVVSNSMDLNKCLKNAESGWVIALEKGFYFTSFVLKHDNVIIVGKGSETILTFRKRSGVCFLVTGNGCNISDVKIMSPRACGIRLTGSRNTIKNVEFDVTSAKKLYSCCVDVDGNENQLQNLQILNATTGIHLNGCRNVVDQVNLTNVDIVVSVDENSSNNSISNINGQDIGHGITVRGSYNNLSNVTLANSMRLDGGVSPCVNLFGIKHTIENLTCHGHSSSSKKQKWALKIGSPNSAVINSKCGPIEVRENNVTLVNVDCEELIWVSRSVEGIKMVNCNGKQVAAFENVTLIECNFESQILS